MRFDEARSVPVVRGLRSIPEIRRDLEIRPERDQRDLNEGRSDK